MTALQFSEDAKIKRQSLTRQGPHLTSQQQVGWWNQTSH